MEAHTTEAVIFDLWPSQDEIKRSEDTLFVALTPICAAELESKKFEYYIPEDFCSLKMQEEHSDQFFKLFKEWLRHLNSTFKKELQNILSPGVNPVWPIAFYLQKFIGPWYNQLFVLDCLFQELKKNGIKAIEWFGPAPETYLIVSPFSITWKGWKRDSLYSIFCRELALKYGLEIEYQEVESRKMQSEAAKINQQPILDRKALIPQKAFTYIQSKYAEFRNLLPGKAKIIYTMKGQLPQHFFTMIVRNGFKVRNLKVELSNHQPLAIDREIIQSSFSIFREFNKIPVSSLIIKTTESVFETLIPCLNRIVNQLEKEGIKKDSILIARHYTNLPNAGINEYFRKNRIPRATICHGDTFFYCNHWETSEMQFADVYLPSNRIMMKTFSDLYTDVKYFISESRYYALERYKRIRRPLASRKRKKILYLSTCYKGANTKFFKNSADYPGAWYFKVQKALIDALSKKGHDIVYKAYPGDYAENPFLKVPKAQTNFQISTLPFVKTLGTFELMVLDFPSTSMFECIYAGIPCVAIFPIELPIQESAQFLLDKVLFPFKEIKEIPELVDRILQRSDQEFLDPVREIFSTSDNIRRTDEQEIINYFASCCQ